MDRGKNARIISARELNRKERKEYEKKSKEETIDDLRTEYDLATLLKEGIKGNNILS
jgi:hypothetical protein